MKIRIHVEISEAIIEEVQRVRSIDRKGAVAAILEAWILETENMHPVMDEDQICFEAGGA